MIWLSLASMIAVAVLCVAWPLWRPRPGMAAGQSDAVFYRQQLDELSADVERGVLRHADVEATRVELARRLIQAADGAGPISSPVRRNGRAAVAGGVFVVAISAALYAAVGHPREPDAPLAARLTGGNTFAEGLARIETHLASDPDDARGLEIMAPLYMKLGRFDAAARTYRGLIRVSGSTPEREAALGQALVLAGDGVVTAEARQAFDSAVAGDPSLPQARFFEGLAALQDGDKARARATWSALLAEAPPGAPYLDLLHRRIAELDGKPPEAIAAAPSDVEAPIPGPPGLPPGAAAVAALPVDQQRVAIQGMVDGLAARLAADGRDGEGWLKLVRAYRVLGEQDKAVRALADARRSMTGDPQELARLDRLAHELGLES